MLLISCIKGDHLIILGVLDQGATAMHRPMLFFLDERRWMEGIPLHCLQCAPGFSEPARRWGTTPCHRTQKANTETITKPNTYPWNRHMYSHPRLYSVLCISSGGGCLNLYPSQHLSYLHQQETRKFVHWMQGHNSVELLFFSIDTEDDDWNTVGPSK